MTTTAASLAATQKIANILIKQGWTASVSGAAADLRTSNGVVSLGHDGTVVLFGRYHETGYPMAELELGAVDLEKSPLDAAEQVSAFL